jgi:hypothetical protein
LIEFMADGSVAVNRTAFHEAMKSELQSYRTRLLAGTDAVLRRNFTKKMNALAGTSN